MLALAPDALGPDIRPISADEAGWPGARRPDPRAFLRSLGPALDRAFGLEDAALAPPAILALVARLRDGPLGAENREGPGLPTTCGPVPA